MNPDQILSELRAIKERESLEQRAAIKRWLEIALIAVPAVYSAGIAGNVTCRAAMLKIQKLTDLKKQN